MAESFEQLKVKYEGLLSECNFLKLKYDELLDKYIKLSQSCGMDSSVDKRGVALNSNEVAGFFEQIVSRVNNGVGKVGFGVSKMDIELNADLSQESATGELKPYVESTTMKLSFARIKKIGG